MLDRFRTSAAKAGVMLDLDGTLSEIVRRPELAQPVPGAEEVISSLVGRYAVVAVVSGRSSDEIRERIRVPGVMVVGSYGMSGEPLSPAVFREADEAARRMLGAWTEAKGPSVAVHYRETADPVASRETLTASLGSIASRAGLQLLEGKMVLELVRPGVALKGGAVQRICRERGLDAALYAGDDFADLEAFSALDGLALSVSIKVAVSGPETPDGLIGSADVVVDGPAGLVQLLGDL